MSDDKIVEATTEEVAEKVTEETVPSNPQQECAKELNDVLVKYGMTLQPTMSLVPMEPMEEEVADVVVEKEVVEPEDESEG